MNLFTSEQVSAGHPDKICDQISDAILTECLKQDPYARAGIECLIKNNNLFIAGEMTTSAKVDITSIAKNTAMPLMEHGETIKVYNYLSTQSPDIAMGVNIGGAGDQGMMFGYACRDTEQMMPLPWAMATDALKSLDELRINNPNLGFLPDAKSQVTYDRDNNAITTFLISTQHETDMDMEKIKRWSHHIMYDICDKYGLKPPQRKLVNPTGRFVIGGPYADAGLTGRKIIADTYGGYCAHGGGAFSGKDPTKVDRSGAYMARKIAKDILRDAPAHIHECVVQLAYAIGVAEPVSIYISLDGKSHPELAEKVMKTYDLTPKGIIDKFDLKHFNYNRVSAYGHFGKEDLPWEA